MIKDDRLDEDYRSYEYYELYGWPLRVVLDKEGRQRGGDRLNANTSELCMDTTVLSDVFKEEDCNSISEEQFYELCSERIREKYITDHRDSDDLSRAQYYSLRGHPVRVIQNPDGVVLNKNGNDIDSDILNTKTGEFERYVDLTQDSFSEPDCHNITKDAFYALCIRLVRSALFKDTRNPDDYGEYRYYNFRGQMVRVILNKEGVPTDCDILNSKAGTFEPDTKMIKHVLSEYHCYPMTEDKFYALCERLVRSKNIHDPRNPEDFGGFKYYNLRLSPVRIALDKEGNPIMGDILDEKAGMFKPFSIIQRVMSDHHCNEITKEEFDDACEALVKMMLL